MNETMEKITMQYVEALGESKDRQTARSIRDNVYENLRNMGYSVDISIAVGNAAAAKLLELVK